MLRSATPLALVSVLVLSVNGCGGGGDGSGGAVAPAAAKTYAIGGSVSGLTDAGLVLANGDDSVAVAQGSTSFRMPRSMAAGSAYDLRVGRQPGLVACEVRNGSGTVASSDVAGVAVVCTANAHGVGGTVSGLNAAGLVLGNGADRLAVAADAVAFTMPAPVTAGASYAVGVVAQPAGLTCSVGQAAGTVATMDVSTVAVVCAPITHAVGGTIHGLAQPGLVLVNGTDTRSIAAGTTGFTMPSPVAEGAAFSIAVAAQPVGMTCSVANGNGSVATADVATVDVTCSTNAYPLGGTIAGAADAGLVLANGGDLLNVAAGATTFAMPGAVAYGGGYALVVRSAPSWTHCAVTNGAGTMGAAPVTGVAVQCAPFATVSTIAGLATVAGAADGSGAAARFHGPYGVAIASTGDLFVSDYYGNTIRKVTRAGVVTTFAGAATADYVDGTGTAARFDGPAGLAIDAQDNLYVADFNNHRIRKISPAGVVTTLAGSGAVGPADGVGTAAEFGDSFGVAVDSTGVVYVADAGNHRIRSITPAGVVSTLAGSTAGDRDGSGSAAMFHGPGAIAVDRSDDLVVADSQNFRIRKVTRAGVVTTLAGSGTIGHADGQGTAASFSNVYGIVVGRDGAIYASDTFGNTVRKVTAAGAVTTLAGATAGGHADGVGSDATFLQPAGLVVDDTGALYVADFTNDTVRKLTP